MDFKKYCIDKLNFSFPIQYNKVTSESLFSTLLFEFFDTFENINVPKDFIPMKKE